MKNSRKYLPIIAISGIFILGSNVTFSQSAHMETGAPNNSTMNKKKKIGRMTVDQSDMSASDTELVRKVREGILQDETLSMYGKSVNVIATDGILTLKGPVQSASERQIIMRKVQTMVGVNKVNNELSIVTQ